MQQLNIPYEQNWGNEINLLKKKYNITSSTNEIIAMSRDKWKTKVKTIISQYAFEEMKVIASKMSKLKEISYTELKVQPYLVQLKPNIARSAMKIRLGMIDCRINYKNKYKQNLMCSKCSREEETVTHLVMCQTGTSIDIHEIYGKDVEKIEKLTEIIEKALYNRENGNGI